MTGIDRGGWFHPLARSSKLLCSSDPSDGFAPIHRCPPSTANWSPRVADYSHQREDTPPRFSTMTAMDELVESILASNTFKPRINCAPSWRACRKMPMAQELNVH